MRSALSKNVGVAYSCARCNNVGYEVKLKMTFARGFGVIDWGSIITTGIQSGTQTLSNIYGKSPYQYPIYQSGGQMGYPITQTSRPIDWGGIIPILIVGGIVLAVLKMK